jgi:hypothetical protein
VAGTQPVNPIETLLLFAAAATVTITVLEALA